MDRGDSLHRDKRLCRSSEPFRKREPSLPPATLTGRLSVFWMIWISRLSPAPGRSRPRGEAIGGPFSRQPDNAHRGRLPQACPRTARCYPTDTTPPRCRRWWTHRGNRPRVVGLVDRGCRQSVRKTSADCHRRSALPHRCTARSTRRHGLSPQVSDTRLIASSSPPQVATSERRWGQGDGRRVNVWQAPRCC
jgi:hypothetical protein